MVVVSIKDNKGHYFHKPVVMESVREAERSLAAVVNLKTDKPGTYQEYPEDFDLYLIGQFDNVTGQITPQDPEYKFSLLSLWEGKDGN